MNNKINTKKKLLLNIIFNVIVFEIEIGRKYTKFIQYSRLSFFYIFLCYLFNIYFINYLSS